MVFSDDGRWLATGAWEATQVWRLRPDELLAEACGRLQRDFTDVRMARGLRRCGTTADVSEVSGRMRRPFLSLLHHPNRPQFERGMGIPKHQ